MAERGLEQRVEMLERQATAVAQILPTLATKADLADLKAATKADLTELKTELRAEWKADIDAAVAPLATKAELKAEGEETRRHFDVVAEGLRADVRLMAEKLDATEAGVDARHADVMRILTQHDRRITRLEASSKPR